MYLGSYVTLCKTMTGHAIVISPIKQRRTVIDINESVGSTCAITGDLFAVHGSTGCDTVSTYHDIWETYHDIWEKCGTERISEISDP